jgi:hypothetical protein
MTTPLLQYAKLPTYQYSRIENRQYQKFDRETRKLSYYPIISSATAPPGQDNNADIVDPESNKEGGLEPPAVIDATSENDAPAQTDSSSSPESESEFFSFIVGIT